ncbi:ERF family protein [Desulfolucanica intricata]|uniref:ERF family protein n=1 Tax=Desulfolucanica intricata TaxID=1285191 RepID=UPI000834FDB2|nr:ERF family protein [Desulfolucanica intricata]
MSQPSKAIYAKLAKVMSMVERVPKNGYNKYHNYSYTTETDLSESIRPILIECGLAFFSSVEEQERNGEFTKVKMKFVLADNESGEILESYYYGEGQDKGDKGLYKAYTGATKYFLMKTFLIPTGDDPEQDAENPGKSSKSQGTEPPQNTKKDDKQVQHLDAAKARKMIFKVFNDIAKSEGVAPQKVQEIGKNKIYKIFNVDSLTKLSLEQWEGIVNSSNNLKENIIKYVRKLKQDSEDTNRFINEVADGMAKGKA